MSSRMMGTILGDTGVSDREKEKKTMINGMYMSAYANAQRRTVVYEAKVSPDTAAMIEELLKEGENLEALVLLKSSTSQISIVQGLPNAKKFWEQIPNPDLDPFHN
jgi:ribosome biogenesis SPOUT family RNA methylase Rps3